MTTALTSILASSRRLVFFGGAGVSTESGIPDFRSPKGLLNRFSGSSHPAEQILSRTYFRSYPAEFYDYYRRNLLWPDARPNPAHLALADLERAGVLTAVVTQNIDGLHQAAGSRRVLELHGSVQRNRCVDCARAYELAAILETTGIPRCTECGGIVRPDIVLYEESLDAKVMDESTDVIAEADTLVIGGTSLLVQPAASLLSDFRGSKLVVINKERTSRDHLATLVIRKPIGEVLALATRETLAALGVSARPEPDPHKASPS